MTQDMLARANAYASEQIGAMRTLRAFTNESMVVGSFAHAVEKAYQAARSSIQARAILPLLLRFFLVFSSIVAVLWFGSRDVLAGTMSAARSASLCSMRCLRAVPSGLCRKSAANLRKRPVQPSASWKFSMRSRALPRLPIRLRCRSRRVVDCLRECLFFPPHAPMRRR